MCVAEHYQFPDSGDCFSSVTLSKAFQKPLFVCKTVVKAEEVGILYGLVGRIMIGWRRRRSMIQ